MKKSLALLVCTTLLAGMLTGCGSSETATETPAETETTTEETVAEETAESTEGKVWVIATDTVFKPFEYTNENNEFVGIDVDILAAIAEDQGFEYELQSLG